MNAPAEAFQFRRAVREQTPLLLGLVGPSGSGKTYSALRLATGIQSVVGGKVAAIDTEARRMLHYAGRFDFEYLEFGAPFGSDRYLAAVRSAVLDLGAKTVIVDSMSHEHEGPGGHLEFHDEEVARLMEAGGFKSEFAAQIPAWTRPSARRRRLINGLLQLPANLIFCFRAKEKIKLVKRNGRTEPVELGWQAIAGEEFVYEMTDRFLLPPGCEGRPAWDEAAQATGVPKVTEEHREFFPAGAQLSEEIGVKLATWAQGKPGPLGADVLQAFAGIGVTAQQIAQHLGREPTAQDAQVLRAWFRELKTGGKTVDRSTSQIDPADRPDTGAEPKDDQQPQRQDAPEHPSAAGAPKVTYAKLTDRIKAAADREAAELVLDEGRALPEDQQCDLKKLADEKFPQD